MLSLLFSGDWRVFAVIKQKGKHKYHSNKVAFHMNLHVAPEYKSCDEYWEFSVYTKISVALAMFMT